MQAEQASSPTPSCSVGKEHIQHPNPLQVSPENIPARQVAGILHGSPSSKLFSSSIPSAPASVCQMVRQTACLSSGSDFFISKLNLSVGKTPQEVSLELYKREFSLLGGPKPHHGNGTLQSTACPQQSLAAHPDPLCH